MSAAEPTGPRILVLGAGLAGLAAARLLAKAGAVVALWEAESEPGGVVQSAAAEGFLFELGPNTVPQSAARVQSLAKELGLDGELIQSSDLAARRFLFLDGRLQALPASPLELLQTRVLSGAGKLRLLSERLRRFEPPPPGAPEPSFHELVEARFGPEVAERLAGAFVRGIYAGDARRLGARSAFPRLWRLLEQHGSVLAGVAAAARAQRGGGPRPSRAQRRARAALLSLRGGFGDLVRARAADLGPRLELGRRAVRLLRGPRGFEIEDQRGGRAEAERLLLALPAGAAGRLLAPIAPRAAALLSGIRHAAVHTLHLGFRAADFELDGRSALPAGFGFLVPPGETGPAAPRCLGALFPSQIFPGRAPAGCVSASLFYASETLAADPRGGVALALEDLARGLGLPRPPTPLVALEKHWPQGIAQAEVGHGQRLDALRATLAEELPGVELAGGYAGGVSVEDTLQGGERAAERLLGRPAAGR
jgi:oxygen-dependent protoporphyrinogen oxidase